MRRRWQLARRGVTLLGGAGILVATIATGLAGSPLLPLIAGWAAFSRGTLRRPVPVACAALMLIGAIDALAGSIGARGGVALAAVALLTVGIGRMRTTGHARNEAPADMTTGPEHAWAGAPARAIADVREWCGARGAALWRVDANGRQARLIAAAGRRPPSSVATSGTPLGWVAETGTALPLEPPPDWVDPTATLMAARLPRGEASEGATHMLTLELPRDTIATQALLTCAAAFVGGALDQDAERTRHAGELARSRQLLVALQVLPRETEPSAFADRLLETALLLTGGSGAALASWAGDDGEILHSRGNDGGPQPGEAIESPQSEMALAARAGATIVRARAAAKGQAVPIANRSESWNVRPRTWATVPLRNGDDVVGTISVWSTGEEALHESGIGMLDAIARLSGAQLSIVRSLGALRHSAERDPLTGLFNRRGFDRIFAAEVARTERYGRPVAVLAIDIDHFKSINDRFGHDAGDVVLRAVSQTIAATIREADTAARVGGEEFLVLMPETGLLAAREAAERVRRHVAALRSRAPELATDVRVSIGVSTVPDCVAHPSLLLGTADEALYTAKRNGRDRVRDARGGVEKGVDLA